MLRVVLAEQDWVRALNAMALAPYREIQPLIDAISKQLLAQKQNAPEAEQQKPEKAEKQRRVVPVAEGSK